jgi:hypothetical protein
MKKWSITLALFAVVALTVAESSHPLYAKTSDSLVASAQGALQAKLLEPLEKKEKSRSRFSRAVLPPRARRIRILDNSAQIDAKGQLFVQYAIDENRTTAVDKEGTEAAWLKDTLKGCVYPESGDVMVKRGEVYYASSVLLGAQTPIAPADVCRAR